MGQNITVEQHIARGSADAIVEPPEIVNIFEFKTDGTGTAKEALEQVEQKGYATKYEQNPDDTREVVKIGAVSDNDLRTIGQWQASGELAD